MVKELPISTQDKLNLIHEFRMAETMDDIIRWGLLESTATTCAAS
jgi:hypothetical protein